MKGINAVLHAKKFLESNGFITSEAQKESANGHDLVTIKNGRGFTFEVKPASRNKSCIRISKVTKSTSDGLIVVFPSGHCQVYEMKDHLRNCSKDGYRFLTFIGNVLC